MIRTVLALFLVSILIGTSMAQNSRTAARKQAVVIPNDIYFVVIAYQPECPLKIERANILRRLDGKRVNVYDVSNRGSKAIRSFSVALWNSDNTGDVIPWSANENRLPIMPGQSLPSEQVHGLEIIPLTDSLRKKLMLQQGLRGIAFFMVTEVTFEDGTEYDGRSQLDSLEKHLELFETSYYRLRQRR